MDGNLLSECSDANIYRYPMDSEIIKLKLVLLATYLNI